MYNVLSIPVIAISVGLLLFATTEAACLIAKRSKAMTVETPYDLALSPAFTLVALLLGFVFAMALGRYDARSGVVVREASAIRELAFLCEMLDEPTAQAMRQQLRTYVDARLAFALADGNPVARVQAAARSDEVQRELGRVTAEANARTPDSGVVPLVITSLSAMISLSAEEAALLAGYIPPAIIIMLVIVAVLASGILGFRLGCQGQRSMLAGALLAMMTALTLGTVIDLDQPQRGFIRVDLEPLRVVQRSLG